MRDVIDLTRPMTRETLIALGGRRVTDGWMVGEVQVEFLRSYAAGHNTAQCVWRIGDHLGTHVDAPVHVIEGAPAIDQVDLSRLVGDALVADCPRAGAGASPRATSRRPPPGPRPGDILLLYVDEPPGDLGHFIEHQTFVTVPAARWIVDPGISAVGVETACFEHAYQRTVVDRAYEPPETNPWPAYRVCLENDVYIIEGLTGLGPLAGQRVTSRRRRCPSPARAAPRSGHSPGGASAPGHLGAAPERPGRDAGRAGKRASSPRRSTGADPSRDEPARAGAAGVHHADRTDARPGRARWPD